MTAVGDSVLQRQIHQKFNTFTRFNYRQTARQIRKTKRKPQISLDQVAPEDIMKLTLSFLANTTDLKKKPAEELVGVKSQRRQRFKKCVNPLQIITHYTEKENFKPSDSQRELITRLVELKTYCDKMGHSIDLNRLLKKIYNLMSQAVDLNQMRFLCLLVILAGNVCFHLKDENRAFYFYNEARKFSTYAELQLVKIDSLLAISDIAQDLKLYDCSNRLLKKALQYAWRAKNTELELRIYDSIGKNFYNKGEVQPAQYYHRRFSQGQVEAADSAIKRISVQMLHEFEKQVNSLEKTNLTTLFLEYVDLPIMSLADQIVASQFPLANYTSHGLSPRVKKLDRNQASREFQDAAKQINKLLQEDDEFKSEIPFPDVQRNFVVVPKYGKPRKNISFEKSPQFHKIVGIKTPQTNFESIYGYSLQQRVSKRLSQETNPNWWQNMVDKLRKDQVQKLGHLKDRIRNSHQSYAKYPQERRRAQSLRNQGIKQSFNQTLLDWIDPAK